jgi:molybdopterin converting factor small subunit
LVHIAGSIARNLAGGAAEVEVAATTYRDLLLELEARFPGLGRAAEQGMALAIDGVIVQNAYGASFAEAEEVVLIPRIGGG